MMVYDPSVNSTLAPLEVTSMFVVPCGHSSGDICSLIDMQRKTNFSKQTRVCWETWILEKTSSRICSYRIQFLGVSFLKNIEQLKERKNKQV